MISIVEFKKYVADTGILGIIVSKLRHRNKLCPIILFEVDKSSKIGFCHIILSFSLAGRLWIKDDRKFLLDA